MSGERGAALLSRPVAVGRARKPFAELTVDDVERHAELLGSAAGFGHGARIAGVASAWRRLARLLRERGAGTVGELDPAELEPLAEPLWIEPPGGSILP
jgi:hypothetical protein